MSGPYRGDTSEGDGAAEATRDPGIVGDIIAQFADPLAFYRELVQNSIDAGSPSVEIRIAYDESAGTLGVAVRDRGSGMTRDILENQLLVLFRSSKEHDDTKIGKFGIGFASVLAPNPEVVVVQTSRDGRRLTLHLARDLTYQLYDAGPATQTGTTVELVLAMRADEVAAFVRASIAALERWCRHASVPIELTADVPGADPTQLRIDRPLGLDGAVIEARGETDDGKLIAVVGITAPVAAYTGFFNHGLMLHETTELAVGRLAVKLQDSRLGHTLSRDDVRRDAHFDRALGFARELARTALPAAAATALRSAADAGDHARWRQLVGVLDEAGVELDRRAWCFPLVEPIDDRRAALATTLGRRAWASAGPTRLTALLARTGVPVLHCELRDRVSLKALVATVADCELRDLEHEMTIVTPRPPGDAEVALLALLSEVLAIAYRAPSAIVVAQLLGVFGSALAVGGNAAELTAPHLLDRDQVAHSPFGRHRVPLVLSVDHPAYRAALAGDPRAGASLLARLLLLHHGILDVARSTAILEHALDQLDAGGRA
jgi:molecular chaperone HtpG